MSDPLLSECFPNGTMTALALKLESVPSLNPSQLTLNDPTCGPTYSNEHYAYFVFTANSCGTTRKVLLNVSLVVSLLTLILTIKMSFLLILFLVYVQHDAV